MNFRQWLENSEHEEFFRDFDPNQTVDWRQRVQSPVTPSAVQVVHSFIKDNPLNINWVCQNSTSNQCNKVSHMLLTKLKEAGIEGQIIFGKGARFDLPQDIKPSSNPKVMSHWAIYVPAEDLVIDLTGAQYGYNQVFYHLHQWQKMWDKAEFAKAGQYRILDKTRPWEDRFEFETLPQRYPIPATKGKGVT